MLMVMVMVMAMVMRMVMAMVIVMIMVMVMFMVMIMVTMTTTATQIVMVMVVVTTRRYPWPCLHKNDEEELRDALGNILPDSSCCLDEHPCLLMCGLQGNPSADRLHVQEFQHAGPC